METRKAAFRLRGYKCTICEFTLLVFGEGNEPQICEACGKNMGFKISFDQWLEETVKVVPYNKQDK